MSGASEPEQGRTGCNAILHLVQRLVRRMTTNAWNPTTLPRPPHHLLTSYVSGSMWCLVRDVCTHATGVLSCGCDVASATSCVQGKSQIEYKERAQAVVESGTHVGTMSPVNYAWGWEGGDDGRTKACRWRTPTGARGAPTWSTSTESPPAWHHQPLLH